ncbi:MAG: hypothetical protein JKX72_08625 [Robiginitomaculum sp.]|nr:hypothetical protein [Robiginitomaculum sp.]
MNDLEKSAQALNDFAQGPAKDAANAAAEYFERAGKRMASALEGAALSGELSIRDMAASIARDLASLAIQDLLISPLEAALRGGNSAGGSAGISQLNPVNIVMNLSGISDASGFQKSQGQISASLARAVAQGQKFT